MNLRNSNKTLIRSATQEDAGAICKIYNHYVDNSVITFEEQAVSAREMCTRIQQVQQQNLPWLVAMGGDEIIGYAYATRWKERSAYRFSVEITVYVSQKAHNKGVGTTLYRTLLSQLKELGFNSVIGGITMPNQSSIALHEKLGMKQVALFQNIGYKFGQWHDVGYWQLHLMD